MQIPLPSPETLSHLVHSGIEPALALGLNQAVLSPVGGGDINIAYGIRQGEDRYFLKLNHCSQLAMFEAEAAGLQAIAATQTIRTGEVIGTGVFEEYSWLLMSWLEIQSQGDWVQAGRNLAQLHLAAQGDSFGFDETTYCGTRSQNNRRNAHWATFFTRQRLLPQLQTFYRCDADDPQLCEIIDRLAQHLKDHHPQPALVHGDLWSGNIGFADGDPVIFDPAAYYGDAETDLAMTELFGRFPEDFYLGYASVNTISNGYTTRRPIYQLYHLLNHANLFGGGYRYQSESLLQQLTNRSR